MTYGQIRDAIQAAVAASIPDDPDKNKSCYVEDFDESLAYYYYDRQVWSLSYSIDDEGNVALSGEPQNVRPVTSYEAVEEGKSAPTAPMEMRGRSVDPARRAPEVQVRSEPLTYRQGGPNSYFRDLLLTDRVAGASDRLRRHRVEMEMIREAREQAARRALVVVGAETRAEPNRMPGYGGYFTPPGWLEDLFATARRPGEVLSALIPASFGCPLGISSISLPALATGTAAHHDNDNAPVPDDSLTDMVLSSSVVTIAGQEDVALQILEQSPAGASADIAIFADLAESAGLDLEYQLLFGLGAAYQQLAGAASLSTVSLSYTSGAPTGSAMWPCFAQLLAQVADQRKLPSEVLLMRSARWAWLMGQEDSGNRPFGLPPAFLGSEDDTTPDPVSGIILAPVFLNDAIPANLGAGANEDATIRCRPSDYVIFKGDPVLNVMRDVTSGALGARVQMHRRVAAINRYPSGVGVLSGTGFAVQSGY